MEDYVGHDGGQAEGLALDSFVGYYNLKENKPTSNRIWRL